MIVGCWGQILSNMLNQLWTSVGMMISCPLTDIEEINMIN